MEFLLVGALEQMAAQEVVAALDLTSQGGDQGGDEWGVHPGAVVEAEMSTMRGSEGEHPCTGVGAGKQLKVKVWESSR